MKIIGIIVALIGIGIGVTAPMWIENNDKKEQANEKVASSKQKAISKKEDFVHAQIDAYIAALISNNKFAGDMAIYDNGIPAYERTYLTDGESLTESKEVYKYKIGSITKTFTAVLIFQLMEQGKLELDTKLAKFFPKIPNAELISIKQMLNHHSGLHNYTDEQEFASYFMQDQSKEFLINKIASYSSDFEPGSSVAYSNSNYLLLGYIIEEITGKPYAKVVLEKIIEPLNLKHTYYGGRVDSSKNEVSSYYFMEKWLPTPEWSMTVAGAAGAMLSTAADLNLFFKALFDGDLIDKISLAKMIEIKDGYGHGIFSQNYQLNGKEYLGYWHNGGIESFNSHMVYFPELKLGYSLLSNGKNFDLNNIRQNVLKAYLGEKIKIPTFEEFVVKEQDLIPLAGDYISDTHPLGINVSMQNGKLYAQATGQGKFLLKPIKKAVFEYQAAGIEMRFDSANEQFLIKQGPRADIFTKKNSKKENTIDVSKQILKQYVGVYSSESFPLDIEINLEGSKLMAQASGQSAFPLTAVSETEFKFDLAGIKILFDAKKSQLLITQGGSENLLQKK